jgi:hypothetical protein
MVTNGGSNRNLLLFVRGNAVACATNIKVTNQFSKPIRIVINKRKFITKMWAVTVILQIQSCAKKDSGCPISIRISILRDNPTVPDQALDTKYNVPMSLYIIEKNHPIKISGVDEIILNNTAMLAIGCKSV